MTDAVTIPIQRLPGNEDIPLPRYMSEHAAGMDIFAAPRGDVVIAPGERVLIPAGIALAVPRGFEAQLRPRSGLALHHGISLVNTPGTIDADYRGEVGVIVINHGNSAYVVRRGDRIAQMVVHPVSRVQWEPRDELEPTSRGEKGFGHTSLDPSAP